MLNNFPEYLMLKASYGDKHWTPPKGHVDPGENDLQTALRETQEEAGLKESDLEVKDFKVEVNYDITTPGRECRKEVIYFLAKVVDPKVEVKLSEEHTDLSWGNLQQAGDLGGYDEMRNILKKCDTFISQN